MLQDLDHLTARIGQLVQLTRQLRAERDTLRTTLEQSQTAQRTLEHRCRTQEAEIQTLQTKLREHDGAVDDLLGEARQAELELRAQLAKAISEQQAIEATGKKRESELLTSLAVKDTELQRLRVATEAARERIDTVLARLPGAPAPEQLTGAHS